MRPDLVTFTEEILNGKRHFLCSETLDESNRQQIMKTACLPSYHHISLPTYYTDFTSARFEHFVCHESFLGSYITLFP